MAEKEATAPKTDAAPAAAPEAKKFPIKTVAAVFVVLVIEGAAISAAFMIAGKPNSASASGNGHAAPGATEEKLKLAESSVELVVVAEKYQNMRSGRTYIYDTEIFLTVRRKHEDKVKEQLKTMSAQISADIGSIFRRAELATLLEPTLATLQRQIKAVLDERLGQDEEHKPIVQEVLIKKYTQYRADN